MNDETMTTERLGEAAIHTVQQMTPDQKAILRMRLKRNVEKPLGQREKQRLRGELLCYRDAKDYLGEVVADAVLRKEAIARLYKLSGGTKWLSVTRVQRIATETLGQERQPLAARIARHPAPAQVKVDPEAARLQLVKLSLEKLLNASQEEK